MEHLRPKPDRGRHKIRLVRVHNWSLPNQVGLQGPDHLSLLEDLPESKGEWRDDEHGIVLEESGGGPGTETGVSKTEYDDDFPGCAEIPTPGLEPTAVGELFSIDSLGNAGMIKEYIGHAHCDEVY